MHTAEPQKSCTKCELFKPRYFFPIDPKQKKDGGRISWCRDCRNSYVSGWRDKNEVKCRGYRQPYHAVGNRRRNYGLSNEGFINLLEVQRGCCALCGTELKDGGRTPNSLVVDHCHGTGKVRGLLCRNCNSGIGLLKDSPELHRKAAAYIEAGGQ